MSIRALAEPCSGRPAWGADDVPTAYRVGQRMGLLDFDGRVLARPRGSSRVEVVSGPWAEGQTTSWVIDLARPADRRDDIGTEPLGLALDLAIMRQRPEVRAIAVGAPVHAMALGSVGREILPLTHTGAEVALQGAAWIEPGAYVALPADADELAHSIGAAGYVHVPGIALLALGSEPLDALRRLDVLETLARMTMAATELQDEPTLVTTEQAADIPRQRPVEPRPSRDYRRYYRSLDPGVDAPGPDLDPPRNEVDRVKRDVAHACRLLASAGDLVAFFEHVSHRIPGADDRFAMSPAKDFASMRPDDIGIIAVEGECEQLEGDIPAAPFRWYHRDVFAARPDVTAIVHTHELLGRAYVAAGAAPPPVHRAAAHGLRGHTPPVFRTPSLLFDASDRADMVTLLGDGPWVHSLAHGTDYCASDIAVATRAAIERERHLRFHSMARRLGQPTVLSDDVLDGLEAQLATAQQWWEASTEALP